MNLYNDFQGHILNAQNGWLSPTSGPTSAAHIERGEQRTMQHNQKSDYNLNRKMNDPSQEMQQDI